MFKRRIGTKIVVAVASAVLLGGGFGIAHAYADGDPTPTPPAPQSPFGQAPASEDPAPPLTPSEQLQQVKDFVAQDPGNRLVCENADGSVGATIVSKVDPKAAPQMPGDAPCTNKAGN